jgi:hypothetical protein
MCLEGSGDPYFLELSDILNTKLVRIIHDSCTEDFEICEIETVSNSLIDFLSMLKWVKLSTGNSEQPLYLNIAFEADNWPNYSSKPK